ncbi:MAG: hypothetical protein AAGI68_13155 [Planctomycetota bacterium]
MKLLGLWVLACVVGLAGCAAPSAGLSSGGLSSFSPKPSGGFRSGLLAGSWRLPEWAEAQVVVDLADEDDADPRVWEVQVSSGSEVDAVTVVTDAVSEGVRVEPGGAVLVIGRRVEVQRRDGSAGVGGLWTARQTESIRSLSTPWRLTAVEGEPERSVDLARLGGAQTVTVSNDGPATVEVLIDGRPSVRLPVGNAVAVYGEALSLRLVEDSAEVWGAGGDLRWASDPE